MVSEGAPQSPQGRPKDPQGPPKGAPESPKGSPRSSWGSPCPPKGPPQDPPRSTFDRPRGISKNINFTIVKSIVRPKGGPGSIGVMPLGRSCGLFFSSSASSRFVFRYWWAPRSPFTLSLPVLLSTGFPQGPPRPPLGGKMYNFRKKQMILQCRLFSKSGL